MRDLIRILGALQAALLFALSPPAIARDSGANFTIKGTVALLDGATPPPAHARLVFKLYHPANGTEMDTKYQILEKFALPLEFQIGPGIDMNGRTRWKTYILEVFTDHDRDVLSLAPDELSARTPELVELGAQGIELNLRN